MPVRRKLYIGLFAVAAVLLVVFLIYTGILWPNNLFARKYPVRGVDVSKYQGEIDWNVLAAQDISFAFIKATEGSTHVDEQFQQNWQLAGKTGIAIGAYHFFQL